MPNSNAVPTPPLTPRPIAIVGPGALGSLFAARLALADIPVMLLDYRPDRAQELHAQGIRLLTPTGDHVALLPVTADPRELVHASAAIILVKSYQTEEVAVTLAQHLPADAVALTLQNGLGNVETLQLHLGATRVLGGTTAQGACLEQTGAVRDTGAGPTVIGHPDGQSVHLLKPLAHLLISAGFAVSVTENLAGALWEKAILNAAINPVAALTHLSNGELLQHDQSLQLMTAAAREAFMVAVRHGIDIPEQDWRARLQTVCQATAENINSMLQDVLLARRTEIHAINGAIVRTATQHGRPAPINHTLWLLVSTLEKTYRMRVLG